MNIVTPLPIANGFPTNNVGTESARRDNIQKESIPAVVQGEKSAAEKGLGAEQERATAQERSSSAFNQPTYENPSIAQQNKGNDAQQESAGKQDAQDKQQEQSEQKEIAELKARDLEVRLHEQAHAAVGGQYAGSPTYDYEQGPDGNRYAVGGEVKIDVSEAKEPEQTVRKMQQVKAAALAPAEPSTQDYKVAAEAAQKEQVARSEVAQEKVESLNPENDNQDGAANKEQGASAQDVVAGFYANVGKSNASNISLSA